MKKVLFQSETETREALKILDKMLNDCSDKARYCLSLADDLIPYLSSNEEIEKYKKAMSYLKGVK